MAQAGDRLMTVRIGATYGFALADDHRLGICLTPGTELAFDQPVATRNLFGARFSRWLNRDKPRLLVLFRQKALYGFRHDFLEFPDSHLSCVATLYPGQTATVLQIPPPRRTVRKKRRTPKEPKLTDVRQKLLRRGAATRGVQTLCQSDSSFTHSSAIIGR
jgi:hypothetical protein